MAGAPDFQSAGRPFAPPVVIWDGDVIGLGPVNYGPFGLGAMPFFEIGISTGAGDMQARIVFEQPDVPTGWNVEYVVEFRNGEPGYYLLPVPAERLALVALRGTVGGQTANGWIANTIVPRSIGAVDSGAILLYSTNAALAAGATATVNVSTFCGQARLTFNGVGAGTWTVLGTGLDRAGTEVSRWFVSTALAGDLHEPILLPWHRNRLQITNNAGVAAQYTATIVALN